MSKTLEFWFEFASSYSYLSVMRVEPLAREAGVEVAWRPFLLGPVFLSLGWNDSPFNIYPPKGRQLIVTPASRARGSMRITDR